MNNTNNQDKKDTPEVAKPAKLQLSKTMESSRSKQGFTAGAGRTAGKAVTVEVRRARGFAGGRSGGTSAIVEVKRRSGSSQASDVASAAFDDLHSGLSGEERQARLAALKAAEEATKRREAEEVLRREAEAKRKAEEEEYRRINPGAAVEEAPRHKKKFDDSKKAPVIPEIVIPPAEKTEGKAPRPIVKTAPRTDEEEAEAAAKSGKIKLRREEPRRAGRLTITQALDFGEERQRSLASVKRQREKQKRLEMLAETGASEKVIRDVVVPETISVQELANRMAERVVDVVKSLMKLGVLASPNHVIDADTAELIVSEYGHKLKRVTDADVENVLRSESDENPENMKPRAPVVTIMGHVDHGKTSLLDALRKTDVVAGEAGGITQHIGAYQVQLSNNEKITFLDTPGHEAFTAMRLRGARVTDIVVLVVAADDGVREQTVEAINHAKAAGVPMIIAINKIDKPGADPMRVRTELMQYELVTEDMGGDLISVEVSAKQGKGLDKLEEAILLQAEIMELKANPDRAANGAVIEAKIDKGRGVVASLLVQGGTIRVGEIVVAGAAYGRVRAIFDDKGNNVELAGPSQPVEILGLNQAPEAGDEFAVVENDKIARDITEYRAKKTRNARVLATAPTLDQLFTNASIHRAKEMPVIVKGDVQGSVEAIIGSITKYSNSEVAVRVLHSGVGAINESDISLAQASNALIVAFNVRANTNTREAAKRAGVDIRYYSVIYDVVDDVKAALSGMLTPHKRENMIGYARIDQIFVITKAGKVAGCVVTEGVIKRGCKVRLLRDNVVIHDGALKTLKRFKDEVKEVKNGQECGMAFENYDDIREGDMIEAYEVEEIARKVE